MQTLRWRNVAGPAAFHAARNSINPSHPLFYHGHDFAEIFWIDAGRGVHLVNNERVPIMEGSLVPMRPTDCHGFIAAAAAPMKMTNIAFPRAVIADLQRRHFAGRPWLFSAAGKLPAARQVEPSQLQRFNRWADELSGSPRENIFLERFLLNLLIELAGENAGPMPEDAPSWLIQACSAIRKPEHFSRGVEHFLQLCGRSREHVARTVRHHLRQTPTEYVNNLRIAYAQRQLEMGSQDILDIAMDCGIQNLSHFYCLFRARTGTTPKKYRRAHGRPLA